MEGLAWVLCFFDCAVLVCKVLLDDQETRCSGWEIVSWSLLLDGIGVALLANCESEKGKENNTTVTVQLLMGYDKCII